MKSTRAEREVNNVCNCGDEYRRTFFEKPSGYPISDFDAGLKVEKQEVLMEEKVYVEIQ